MFRHNADNNILYIGDIMKAIGIIPARYTSTRLPGKPLALILGKPMIQWVYENVLKSKFLKKVIVATDDKRIISAVEDFGGVATLTSKLHQTGTDRCYEVVEKMKLNENIIINIQGDEPFIQTSHIDALVNAFEVDDIEIATLIHPLINVEDYNNTNRVKVKTDENGYATSFSRNDAHANFLHIGLYAFKANVLKKLVQLKPTENEILNRLEQLRWLDNGYKIKTVLTNQPNLSVDTNEDLQKAREIAKTFK